MEQEKRRKYDREFKVEAVKLASGAGRSVSDVAKNLGINENLLYRWKAKFAQDNVHAFPGKGYLKPADEELRQMKRALADVTQERDILKKALAIFSKGPK